MIAEGVVHSTTVGDGRNLAWTESGDPDGPAVIALHGTPGSRHTFAVDEEAWRSVSVRLICPDRPGYGDSPAPPQADLATFAHDIEQLADHLGLDRFAVLGHSGGGPYAAACAGLLRDHVTRLLLVSTIGPPTSGPTPLSPRDPNARLIAFIRRCPRLANVALTSAGFAMSRWPDRAITALTKPMPDCDRAIAERPAIHRALSLDLTTSGSSIGGAFGRDLLLFGQPWPVRPADITVPTEIWHGTQDRNAPIEAARRLHRHIAGSTLHELDAGHFLIYDHIAAIVRGVARSD